MYNVPYIHVASVIRTAGMNNVVSACITFNIILLLIFYCSMFTVVIVIVMVLRWRKLWPHLGERTIIVQTNLYGGIASHEIPILKFLRQHLQSFLLDA